MAPRLILWGFFLKKKTSLQIKNKCKYICTVICFALSLYQQEKEITTIKLKAMTNETRKAKAIKHINTFTTLAGKVFKKDGELTQHKYAVLKNELITKKKIETIIGFKHDSEKLYFQVITMGKYGSRTDHSFWMEQLIKGAGFKIKKANDAPRGGYVGDHFVISKKCSEFLQSLL